MPDDTFIELHWKGSGSPILIRVSCIDAISATKDPDCCRIEYRAGQSATVTTPYETLKARLAHIMKVS